MFNAMIKARNKKGFTLMEMLIVVAIIAILVAVSIPVFTSQLDKARLATDQANQRGAKALAVATYLADENSAAINMFYDAANGKLVGNSTGMTYAKSTNLSTTPVLQVTVNASGDCFMAWVAAANSVPTALDDNGDNLK